MTTCLHCNNQDSDGVGYCSECRATKNSPVTPVSTSQNQGDPRESPVSPKTTTTDDLQARLEKAMRRTELLCYAAAGLGLAILFAIIGIAFV